MMQMIRCPLFVPADSDKKLNKAINTNADCLFIDLEDSVGANNKEMARQKAKEFVNDNKQNGKLLYVRINGFTTEWFQDDLKVVMAAKPDGIVLPKSQSGQDITKLDALLRVSEAENNIEDGATRIIAIVTETALGVLNANQYKHASERLVAMAWGGEDLVAEVGAKGKRDENGKYSEMIQFARIQTLLGAVAAGVQALDGIYDEFKDIEGLKKECKKSYFDGFKGKMAIHPDQIDVIRNQFMPSKEEIKMAKEIVKAFENDKNVGVVSLNGKMIDRPHLIQAQNILEEIQ